MPSPIDKNNVWVFTDFDSFELDMEDSSWTDLSYRFGHFSRNLRKERIYHDDQQKNLLWISNRQLICYDLKTGKYSEFSGFDIVTGICFLQDYVIIGSLHGIYRYTRADGQMERIEEIPLIAINAIQKVDDNIFLINNKYEYNNQTKTLDVKYMDSQNITVRIIDHVRITTGYNTFTIETNDSLKKFDYAPQGLDYIISDRDNIWVLPQDLKNNIIQYSKHDHSFKSHPVGYKRYYMTTCNDQGGIWIYNNLSLLYFDKKDYSIRFIKTDTNSTFRNMVAYDGFILTNTEHEIKLYSKEFLLANTISLDKIIFEENEFSKDKKFFYDNRDYLEKYLTFRSLVDAYGSSVNHQIIEEIRRMKSYFIVDAPNKPDELKEFIDNHLEIIKEDDIFAALFLKLVNLYFWKGELDNALKTDSLLISDYPGFRDEYYRMKMEKVSLADLNIKKIMSGQFQEDEKLWQIGNQYYDLFNYAGPETEVGINMTYPFQYFKKLVELYPASQYADNAAFFMLRRGEELSHEGGDNSYNLEAIGKYQDILEKYPGTELRAEIYYIIGDLYSWCDADYKDMKEYLELALTYLQKIKDDFPEYDKIDEVMSLMVRINQDLPWYEWDLLITSNKNEYSPDEPVVLNFRLTNHAEVSQQVELYNSLLMPNFQLDVTLFPVEPKTEYGKNVPFEEDISDYDETRKALTIKPNELYEEEWNIKVNALTQYGNVPGYFNLMQPGNYKISAYLRDEEDRVIPSNTIRIVIK